MPQSSTNKFFDTDNILLLKPSAADRKLVFDAMNSGIKESDLEFNEDINWNVVMPVLVAIRKKNNCTYAVFDEHCSIFHPEKNKKFLVEAKTGLLAAWECIIEYLNWLALQPK